MMRVSSILSQLHPTAKWPTSLDLSCSSLVPVRRDRCDHGHNVGHRNRSRLLPPHRFQKRSLRRFVSGCADVGMRCVRAGRASLHASLPAHRGISEIDEGKFCAAQSLLHQSGSGITGRPAVAGSHAFQALPAVGGEAHTDHHRIVFHESITM